jgi:hypothetical protein
LLSKYFTDDLYLDSTLTSVLIPAFDIKLQQPVFFSSWKVKKKESPPFPSPTPNPSPMLLTSSSLHNASTHDVLENAPLMY